MVNTANGSEISTGIMYCLQYKQLVIRAKKMTQWIQKNKTENCQNDTKPECHRHQQ